MTSPPRLTSSLFVSALIRRVETEGGHGMVLAKGDAQAGAILIQLIEKGRNIGLFERAMTGDAGYRWTAIGPQDIDNIGEYSLYIERRTKNDPDLWVIELDIANGERLIAEMAGFA